MKKIILAIVLSFTLSGCVVEPIPNYSIPNYINPIYYNIGFLYPNYTGRYYGCGLITSKRINGTQYSFDINENGTFITVYIDKLTHDLHSFLINDGYKSLNKIPNYTNRRQFNLL